MLILNLSAFARQSGEVYVKKGIYTPFFRDKNEPDQVVGPLLADRFPVTNKKFLEFVRANESWRKSKIKSVFAGRGYLEHWDSDLSFASRLSDQPVTNVSWFAAKTYCEKQGKRLATTAEWEYMSDAQNPINLQLILDWYAEAGNQLYSVSHSKVNSFGIRGMHGLIWEWVEDFSSAILAGDSRSSNEMSGSFFCGSGSLRAKDPTQYATFMRIGHRSSLKADSVGRSLGFRCVSEAE